MRSRQIVGSSQFRRFPRRAIGQCAAPPITRGEGIAKSDEGVGAESQAEGQDRSQIGHKQLCEARHRLAHCAQAQSEMTYGRGCCLIVESSIVALGSIGKQHPCCITHDPMIFLFVVDTAVRMGLSTTAGLSRLDCAKAVVRAAVLRIHMCEHAPNATVVARWSTSSKYGREIRHLARTSYCS